MFSGLGDAKDYLKATPESRREPGMNYDIEAAQHSLCGCPSFPNLFHMLAALPLLSTSNNLSFANHNEHNPSLYRYLA